MTTSTVTGTSWCPRRAVLQPGRARRVDRVPGGLLRTDPSVPIRSRICPSTIRAVVSP